MASHAAGAERRELRRHGPIGIGLGRVAPLAERQRLGGKGPLVGRILLRSPMERSSMLGGDVGVTPFARRALRRGLAMHLREPRRCRRAGHRRRERSPLRRRGHRERREQHRGEASVGHGDDDRRK